MIAAILIALLALMLASSLPWLPYSRQWGFGGAAGIAVALLLAVWLRVERVI